MRKYSEYTEADKEELKTLITSNEWSTGGKDVDEMNLAELIKVAQDNSSTAVIYDQTDGKTLDIPTGFDKEDKTTPEYQEAYDDENGKGYKLTENCPDKGIRGFFTPVAQADQPVTFRLTIVYDVFDKKGNKTRSLATATNSYTTSMKDSSGNPVAIKRGNSYRIEITVKPSYLYQLSDGDLDNPVFVQSN